MQNFIYVQETGVSASSGAANAKHRSVKIPGDKKSPQDWLIFASADIQAYAAGPASVADAECRIDILDSATESVDAGDSVNIARVTDYYVNAVTPITAKHSIGGFFLLKDHYGSASNTYKEVCFSTSTATGSVYLRNQKILAMRIPKDKMSDSVFSYEYLPTSPTAVTTTSAVIGAATYTPSKKGRYLVISTLQTYLTKGGGTDQSSNFQCNVYQTTDASTEIGSAARVVGGIPDDAVASSISFGSNPSHFRRNHIDASDANANLRSYPINYIDVVDLQASPVTVSWAVQASENSVSNVEFIRTIIIPVDGNFVFDSETNVGWEESTAQGVQDEYINDFPVGVIGKNTFVICSMIGSTRAANNVQYLSAQSGNLTTDLSLAESDGTNATPQVYYGADDHTQMLTCHMFTGQDTVSLVRRCGTATTFANSVSKMGVVVAFTDMQSQQTDTPVYLDVELSQDIVVPERRNSLQDAVSESLSDLVKTGSPVYTNTHVDLGDRLPNNISVAATDTLFIHESNQIMQVNISAPVIELYDANGYKSGVYTTVASALAALHANGGTVRIAHGEHSISTAITVAQDNVRIEILASAVLIPTGSGAVGLFSFTGDNATLVGPGKIRVDTWVNDQVVVQVAGAGCAIKDLTFEVTTASGTGSNPMEIIHITGSSEALVENCKFLPNAGVRCGYSTLSRGTTVRGNRFTNNDPGQVNNPGGDNFTHRECYEVWRSYAEGWFTFENNRVWGLGDTDGDPDDLLNECVFVQKAAAVAEDGHLTFIGNYFEETAARNYLHIRGVIHGLISGNTFANPDAANDTYDLGSGRLDASIRIDSIDATDVSTFAGRIIINGNEFHRPAEDGGHAIIARRVGSLQISSNVFYLLVSDEQILLDVDTVTNVSVLNNSFDGSSGGETDNCVKLIHMVTGGISFFPSFNYFASGNVAEQFTQDNPFYNQSNCRAFPFGTDYDALKKIGPFSNSIGFSNSGSIDAAAILPSSGVAITSTTTITRSSGSWVDEGFEEGMTFTIASSENGGENDGNYVVATVSALVLTTTGLTNNAADTTATFQPHLFTNVYVGDKMQGIITLVSDGTTSDPLVQTIYTVSSKTGTSLTVTPTPPVTVAAASTKNVVLDMFPLGVNTNLIRNQTTPD